MSRRDISSRANYLPAWEARRVITGKQRLPWLRATGVRYRFLKKHNDKTVWWMEKESADLASRLPARPQYISRNRSTALTPLERAEAILWNILHTNPKKTMMDLVLVACAVEIFLRRSGLRPLTARRHFNHFAITRACMRFLRTSVRTFEHDDGHCNIRTIKERTRMGLWSHNVARSFVELLRPVYRDFMLREEGAITTRVNRMSLRVYPPHRGQYRKGESGRLRVKRPTLAEP